MGPRFPKGSLLLELFELSASLGLSGEHAPQAKDFPWSQLFSCLVWVRPKPKLPFRDVLMARAFVLVLPPPTITLLLPIFFSINFLLLSMYLSHSFLVLLTTKKVITLSLYGSFVFFLVDLLLFFLLCS